MKVEWIIKPVWTAGSKEGYVRLTQDACFRVDGIDYWIPQCYEADGASVPGLFWTIVGPPSEPYNILGALPHDVIYLTHMLSRAKADRIAYELWLQTGKSRFDCYAMYMAVRTFGALPYKNSYNDKMDLAIMCNIIKQRPIEEQAKFKTLWPV